MALRGAEPGSGPSEGSRPTVGVFRQGFPEPGALLGGRFRLVRPLGAGATGVVFEAFDEMAQQKVALKVLRPESVLGSGLERLRREVRLSRPGHPHVVRLNDLHEADDLLLLSMELVEGGSLASRLAGGRRLAVGEVVAVGHEVAGALACLHGNGLVHRDVKPGNLLLDGEGHVKLCDLGLLRPVDHGLTLTASELVVGTPAYMAPEQASGRELTGATDVYALGLTLWQALTGSVPLSGSTAVETLTRRQKEAPPRLRPLRPDVPRWLERLLRRMLSPRPGERPEAAEVEAALAAARFRPLPPPRTLAAAAAALLLLVAVAAGASALLGRSPTRYETDGRSVRGVDATGRTRWSLPFENPVRQLLEVDVDGDGEKEALVVAFADGERPREGGKGRPPSEVALVGAGGRLRTRLRPEEAAEPWPHPFTRQFRPAVQALDLDGDGMRELVVTCPHVSFYPTEVFVYWPRADAWDHLLDHWGHLYVVAPVPGAVPRLRFLAANNALGFAIVLAEVEFRPPWDRSPAGTAGPLLAATPGIGAKEASARWVSYTLLTLPRGNRPAPDAESLEVRPDGGTLVRFSVGDVSLDARGNPEAGPNAGRDLSRLRLELVASGSLFNGGMQKGLGAEAVSASRDRFALRFAPLLAEDPYRLAFDLEFARQLAGARAPAAAASLLRETWTAIPSEEVAYQLAGFLALAGELDESIATLRRLIADAQGVRAWFDAPGLLLRAGAERGDAEAMRVAVQTLACDERRLATEPGLRAALRARANLLTDRPEARDGEVRSWSWAGDGDALAVLARWRLGRSGPGDVDAMTKALPAAGDGEKDVEIALGAALLASRRPEEAARRLRALVESLEWEARRSLERRQQLLLAKALLAKALLASGDAVAGRAQAKEVLESGRPGLIWTNLAREVLSGAR